MLFFFINYLITIIAKVHGTKETNFLKRCDIKIKLNEEDKFSNKQMNVLSDLPPQEDLKS